MRRRLARRLRSLKKRIRLRWFGSKSVLVYVGVATGESLEQICDQYEICYGFEARPEAYQRLKKRFADRPHVRLFQVAAADFDGEIEFHISNNPESSSIGGQFHKEWHNADSIEMVKTIKVPCINLCHFLQQQGVDYIDRYVSDIQGYDLAVLKTLQPWIKRQAIGSITCETARDEYGNIYPDLPCNSESGFAALLGANYKCVAKGQGLLTEGDFSGVPDSWWEMDCMWVPRKR